MSNNSPPCSSGISGGRPIHISRYHPPTPKGSGWVGHDGYRDQVQDATFQPNLDVKQQRWISDRSSDLPLEHHWIPSNPPLSHRFFTKTAHFRQYNIGMTYVANTRSDRDHKTVQTPPLWCTPTYESDDGRRNENANHTQIRHNPVGVDVEKFARSGSSLLREFYLIPSYTRHLTNE